MLTKIISIKESLKEHSAEVIGLVRFYPAKARELITKYRLTNIAQELLIRLPGIAEGCRPQTQANWAAVLPLLQAVAIKWERRPFKAFELLQNIEDHLTEGGTQRTALSYDPFSRQRGTYPEAPTILRRLRDRVGCSAAACAHWIKWLRRNDLNRTGARTLSGYGIQENQGGIYSIPTSYVDTKGESHRSRMHTSKFDMVRQMKDIMGSITGQKEELELLKKELEGFLDIEKLSQEKRARIKRCVEHTLEKLEKRRTKEQKNVRRNLQALQKVLGKGQVKHSAAVLRAVKNKLGNSSRHLDARIKRLDIQYVKIERKRSVMANALLKDVKESVLEDESPEALSEALAVIEAVQSGFVDKRSQQKEAYQLFITRLNMVLILLLDVQGLARQKEGLLLAKEATKEALFILLRKIERALAPISWISGVEGPLNTYRRELASLMTKADFGPVIDAVQMLGAFIQEAVTNRHFNQANIVRCNEVLGLIAELNNGLANYKRTIKDLRAHQAWRAKLIQDMTAMLDISYLPVSLRQH